MTATQTRPRMTEGDVALMRAVVEWRRKASGIDYIPDWYHHRYASRYGAAVTWGGRSYDGVPEIGVTPRYRNTWDKSAVPLEWHRVHSFREAVDLLVTLNYLPARFSSAYRAGFDAGRDFQTQAQNHQAGSDYARSLLPAVS